MAGAFPRPQAPVHRGYIVCLKIRPDGESSDGSDLAARDTDHRRRCNEAARSVVAAEMGNRAVIRNLCSTKTFHGFACRGELSDRCRIKLMESGTVDHIEPDIEVTASSDAMGARAPWGVESAGVLERSRMAKIGSTMSAAVDVDVFVLDTGVQKSHPYLNVVETTSMIDEVETDDMNGHGTLCAGIIGAIDRGWNDGETIDIVGVAPGARIHGLKVLDKNGSGFLSDIMLGVEEVARFKRDNPSKHVVANMSLGGYSGSTVYTALDHVIVDAIEQDGISFVIAAGNNADDASLYTPAHVQEAITVGCFDREGRFSTFSNHGHAVDILAPGTDIQSTTIGSGIAVASGTSFAAPFVCGAVALVLASNGYGTPTEVVGELITLARTTPKIAGVPHGTPARCLRVSSL